MHGMILASIGTGILTIAFVAVSVLLVGLVLLQKNRGAGLSGALGGVGGHTAFGTKTGDFLTWVTVSLAALCLLLAVVGNYVFEQGRAPSKPAAPAQTIPPGSAVPVESAGSGGQGQSPPIQVQATPVQPGVGGAAQPSTPIKLEKIPPPQSPPPPPNP